LSEIVVRGTVRQVRDSLYRISGVVKMRKEEGWPLFGADEHWVYHARMDAATCTKELPIADVRGQAGCYGLNARVFRGDEIPRVFPFYERTGADRIHPHSHEPRDKNCRCELVLQEPGRTLENRLYMEKLAVRA